MYSDFTITRERSPKTTHPHHLNPSCHLNAENEWLCDLRTTQPPAEPGATKLWSPNPPRVLQQRGGLCTNGAAQSDMAQIKAQDKWEQNTIWTVAMWELKFSLPRAPLISDSKCYPKCLFPLHSLHYLLPSSYLETLHLYAPLRAFLLIFTPCPQPAASHEPKYTHFWFLLSVYRH